MKSRNNLYSFLIRPFCFVCLLLLSVWHAKAERLTPYLAETPEPSPAVIICPGGSYSWLDCGSEGEMVARWLQANGISAFVLKYPVQGVFSFLSHYRYFFRGHQYPDALLSLQDAIKEIRSKAKEYHINPNCLGAMGFSAGGHLVVSAAEFFSSADDRPDFVVPVYPVITFRNSSKPHKRSRRALLGEYRKRKQIWQDSLSLELHVRPDMPPVFLTNCVDDRVVHYSNSVLLDSALTALAVPHEYHQYPTGGHGFGANPKKINQDSKAWMTAFINWFDRNFR